LVAGLSFARASLGPRYGDELTIALGPFGGLEPRAAHTPGERLVLGLIHETLLRADADGGLSPSLAADWQQAALGREWSLRLDARAHFHDDSPVTAAAAAASLRRFLRSQSSAAEALAQLLAGGAAFRAGSNSELSGLEVADGERVRLRLVRPSSSVLSALTSPAAAVRSDGERGAGPFSPVLEVPGRRVLARAHLKHVRGRPFLERVLLVARARDPLAEAGFAPSGSPVAQASLLLLLDASKPPFDSSAARAAVSAVIDRADLARRVAGGAPRLAFPELEPRTPGRPAARAAPARFQMLVEQDVPPPASQRLVAWLASLGLRAEVEAVSGSEVRRSSAAARLLLFLPEVGDPVLLLRETAALARRGDLTEALDAADAEPDVARRRALLREIEERLLAERTLLPLASLPVGVASPEGTHGLRFDGVGRLVLEDAWREPR
jgi:MarR-like DNA-binding transcriptional regulator SgrR of sgrS sRNA